MKNFYNIIFLSFLIVSIFGISITRDEQQIYQVENQINQDYFESASIQSPFNNFQVEPDTVGYTIGQIKSKKLLKTQGESKLYQLNVDQMLDNRPYKLIQLIGTHYQVGYAYGVLLGKQVVDTYNIFLSSAGFKGWKRKALQMFLDWQYDSYVGLQIPYCFKDELHGIQDGAQKQLKIKGLRALFQRTLVISSYPDNFLNDITLSLLDQFIRDSLDIKNQKIINLIEDNLFDFAKMIREYMNKMKMHCSFFATWGSRTNGGKLFTMRNLDWQANSGLNKNKMIFVWKIHNQIPHTTLGFPIMLGALTGMSKAGLTVHEAGLDSLRETQLGFQWTLRLRYILMRASTLAEARHIWETTNNTLGMNHMVASSHDVATGEPVFIVQTMRNYTAWFKDFDKRQNKTIFVDPKTKKQFIGGYSMKEAVFRTNHAYDPFINKYRTKLPQQNSSTIKRYNVIKDTFLHYQNNKILIGQKQALNITGNVAHKGGPTLYKCPKMGQDDGNNVLSVMYIPNELKMYAAFEYGFGQKYLTACCGVYVKLNMEEWF